MTNFEKNNGKIREITVKEDGDIALTKDGISKCADTDCSTCLFGGTSRGCFFERYKWLTDECDEPTMTAEEAWETAKQILFKEELSTSMLEEIFGTRNHFAIMRDFKPQEAKANIEAWEKTKYEIKVGDVLKGKDSKMQCVVTMLDYEAVELLWGDGLTGKKHISEIREQFEKTGEHIRLERLLSKIKGE